MPKGPRITLQMSCGECEYCEATPYRVQSDSGKDVRCTHPASLKERYIGDSRYQTPGWCPLLPEAMNEFFERVVNICEGADEEEEEET